MAKFRFILLMTLILVILFSSVYLFLIRYKENYLTNYHYEISETDPFNIFINITVEK